MYKEHLSKFDFMRLLEDDHETRQKIASISPTAGLTYADLSDVDKASVKVDKRKAVYDSTTEKWVGKEDKLSELDDVNVVGMNDGDILSYDNTNDKWTSKSGKLEDICNFDKTDLQDGDFIKYDEVNEKWIPTSSTSTIRHLSDIGNVESDLESTCANGDSIKWDNTNSRWVRAEYSEPIKKLENLEDVHITPATLGNGSILKYNGTRWVNDIVPTINKYKRVLRINTSYFTHNAGTASHPTFHLTLNYISDRDILYTSDKVHLETIFTDICNNGLYNRNMLNNGVIRGGGGVDIPIIGAWAHKCETTTKILYGGDDDDWYMTTDGITFNCLDTSSTTSSSTNLRQMTIDGGTRMLSNNNNLYIEDQLIENVSVPIFGEVTIGSYINSRTTAPTYLTYTVDLVTPPVPGSSLNVQITGGLLACGAGQTKYVYELDPNVTYEGTKATLVFNRTSVITSTVNSVYATINFNSSV